MKNARVNFYIAASHDLSSILWIVDAKRAHTILVTLFWNLQTNLFVWLRFEKTLTNRGALLYLGAPPNSVFYSFFSRPVFLSFNSCLPTLCNGYSTSQALALAQPPCTSLQLSMFLLREKHPLHHFCFLSFIPSSAAFINWPVTIPMIYLLWSAWIPSSVFPELKGP